MKSFKFGHFNFSLINGSEDVFKFSCPIEGELIKDISGDNLISIIYNGSILLKNHIIKRTKGRHQSYLYFVSDIRENDNPLFISIKRKKFEDNIIVKLLKRQARLLKSYACKDSSIYFGEIGENLSVLESPDYFPNLFNVEREEVDVNRLGRYCVPSFDPSRLRGRVGEDRAIIDEAQAQGDILPSAGEEHLRQIADAGARRMVREAAERPVLRGGRGGITGTMFQSATINWGNAIQNFPINSFNISGQATIAPIPPPSIPAEPLISFVAPARIDDEMPF